MEIKKCNMGDDETRQRNKDFLIRYAEEERYWRGRGILIGVRMKYFNYNVPFYCMKLKLRERKIGEFDGIKMERVSLCFIILYSFFTNSNNKT